MVVMDKKEDGILIMAVSLGPVVVGTKMRECYRQVIN